GAEEIVAALVGFGLRVERLQDVFEQPAGLVRRPGKRALIGRNVNEIGVGKQLPKRHRLGTEWRWHEPTLSLTQQVTGERPPTPAAIESMNSFPYATVPRDAVGARLCPLPCGAVDALGRLRFRAPVAVRPRSRAGT